MLKLLKKEVSQKSSKCLPVLVAVVDSGHQQVQM